MFAFWIAAAALSAAAGVLMLRGARAAAARAVDEDPALAVHRRQLAEIDDLAARGLLPDGEVRAARAEAGRRLLAAADAPAAAVAPGSGRRLVLAAAALAPLLALGLYTVSGSPGATDQPYERRLAEWRRTPESLDPPRIAAVMRSVVAERPNDPEGFENLAAAELASGDVMAASAALRRAIALTPERSHLWAALGETFMVEGEGRIGPDARAAFGEALRLDPRSLSARYFLARADIADGKLEQGLAGWRALLASLPADAPARAALAGEIDAVVKAGGLPPPAPAPAQPDEAAIRGMVEGLAARLAAQPNDPQGWVKLVRAWSVLGETDKRDAALSEARERFRGNPEVLRALDEAAR